MKNLITVLSIFFILTNIAFAEQKNITPQKLTIFTSEDYKEINKFSARAFTNIDTSIDTTTFPATYKDFSLAKPNDTQNINTHYIHFNNASLHFDKGDNKLKTIAFKRAENPSTWMIYNYPAGTLKYVEIYKTKNCIYSFNPDGKYMNTTLYMNKTLEKITDDWKGKYNANIKTNKKYTAKFLIKINKNGELVSCNAKEISWVKELDQSAAASILETAPFEPFPKFWSIDNLEILVTFELKPH